MLNTLADIQLGNCHATIYLFNIQLCDPEFQLYALASSISGDHLLIMYSNSDSRINFWLYNMMTRTCNNVHIYTDEEINDGAMLVIKSPVDPTSEPISNILYHIGES